MALQLSNIGPIEVVVGGERYPLSDAVLYAASITVQADYDNVGRIAIGGPDVTGDNGIEIAPGESAVIEFPASTSIREEFDVSTIYLTSATSGDTARAVIIKRV
jgi:hypothetical protein